LTISLPTQYSEHQLKGYSAQAISWIGSVSLFLTVCAAFSTLDAGTNDKFICQFFLATVVGQIFDAYGPRILLVVGTILVSLSLILTSVFTEYYQLMITHGVILGIGSAMLYTPSVSGKSTYSTV
jgi:MFS family permease